MKIFRVLFAVTTLSLFSLAMGCNDNEVDETDQVVPPAGTMDPDRPATPTTSDTSVGAGPQDQPAPTPDRTTPASGQDAGATSPDTTSGEEGEKIDDPAVTERPADRLPSEPSQSPDGP